MTQKQMASILNLTQKSISTYENGLTEPDISTMIKIADYFDVTLDYLLDRTTSKTENAKITVEIGSDELAVLKRAVSKLDEQFNREKYREIVASNMNKKKG